MSWLQATSDSQQPFVIHKGIKFSWEGFREIYFSLLWNSWAPLCKLHLEHTAAFACDSSLGCRLFQQCQPVQFLVWGALENNFTMWVSVFTFLTRYFQVEKRSILCDPSTCSVTLVVREVTWGQVSTSNDGSSSAKDSASLHISASACLKKSGLGIQVLCYNWIARMDLVSRSDGFWSVLIWC